MNLPLNILHVNTKDVGGGAAKVAWDLSHAYCARGHESWMAVGWKNSDDPRVFEIPRPEPRSLVARIRRSLRYRAQRRLGIEDMDFPGSHNLLSLPPRPPDVVHAHNLHGGYFDLRVLPGLSLHTPVVLLLQDAWALSGHCAHSLGCDRWRTGCGQCPNLGIYPAIERDATAYNWQRKRDVYARSRLYVAAACQWLIDKALASMLAPAIVETRVIRNGIDLGTFGPGDKAAARAALDVPQDASVLMFAAEGVRKNVWKDFELLHTAVARTSQETDRQVLCLALGDDAPPDHAGRAEIRFVPYQKDPAVVAQYYRAADVYVHPARADTFPTVVMEALACGKPVVATAVGGVSEQVADGETGFLVPPGAGERMASRIRTLIEDASLSDAMGRKAAQTAQARFGLDRQVDIYLDWYDEILKRTKDTK